MNLVKNFSFALFDTQVTIKSLIVTSGVLVVAIYSWRNRHEIVRYTVIGPYTAASNNLFARTLQRYVVDKTRCDHRVTWEPMHSLLNFQPQRTQDNGHKISGASRDAARHLMTNAILAAGYSVYEISPSCHSVDRDYSTHLHYAVADLQERVRNDDIPTKSILMGIDIDYYVRDFRPWLGRPIPSIFYTFQPRQVAGVDGDAPYRIVNNEVSYEVSGGTNWSHKVYDWTSPGEFVKFRYPNNIKRFLLSLIGLHHVIYHKVHHTRPFNAVTDRAIVWTIPQHSHWEIAWLPKEINSRSLSHVDYMDKRTPGWNSITWIDSENELMINLGRAGEDATTTLYKTDYDVLMGLSAATSVTSRMIGMKYHKPADLALVMQYFNKTVPTLPQCPRVIKPIGPIVHWPAAMEADEAKTSFRSYSKPLVSDENMVPMIKRWESLSCSIDARITHVKNNKTPPRKYQNYCEEFVRCVVPVPHEGIPYDLEETAAMLDKPTQVLAIKQIWETAEMPARRMIECFLKNEPTNKPGRIISSFPDMRFLLTLSQFTLKFRDDVLHDERNHHWFCPGLTPRQIAEKVVEYCSNVAVPLEGDFSNFDGSVSEWAQRHVMNAVYHRYFRLEYMSKLTTLTDMLIACPARAKSFGFRYDPGVGVKSGSPTTCDLNTVLNGFLQYCAVRNTLPELTPDHAYRLIGLAFGDDSLFDKQFGKAFSAAAVAIGMDLKLESTLPETGVTFLARVFPRPTSSITSFQDPIRTMRKLHLTSRDPNIPLSSAAIDRVSGYLVTDGLTPIISEYANMVVRILEPTAEAEEVRRMRKSVDKEKPYWLTTGGAWPQQVQDVPAMIEVMAARTGFSEEVIREQSAFLRTCNDLFASKITMNRDEQPNPYKGTLDADALPAEGGVDPRKFNYERANNLKRANPTPGKKYRPNVDDVQPNDPINGLGSPSHRVKGPIFDDNSHRKGSRTTPQRDQRASGQTNRPETPHQRGIVDDRRDKRQRSPRSDRQNTGQRSSHGGKEHVRTSGDRNRDRNFHGGSQFKNPDRTSRTTSF